MSERDIRPGAVDAAAAWLLENRTRYTDAALDGALREQGYSDAEIVEARLRATATLAAPERRDLRATAAVILIVGFLGVWALVALPMWLGGPDTNLAFSGAAATIFTVLLLLIGLPSLFWVADSGRLRDGTLGALVGILAVPFVLLVILAGLCVVSTRAPV